MAETADSIPLAVIESGEASSNSNDEADDQLIAVSDEPDVAKAAMRKRMASSDFTGLTKAELAKYESDSYWRKVRLILFALICVVWFALLVAAVVVIVVTQCPPRPEVPFYQKDAIYKVSANSDRLQLAVLQCRLCVIQNYRLCRCCLWH